MQAEELDHFYTIFISNLSRWTPEGIIEVDIDLIEATGLLCCDSEEEQNGFEQLPHYFHVLETEDRVTLFNHQFIIWIVPKIEEEGTGSSTLVLIALLSQNCPHLEIVFSASGIYNTPKFILRLLKHYLSEVIDTEQAISSLESF